MKFKLLHLLTLIMIGAGLSMALERDAFAYVDPGNGLLALQAIGSALAAAGFYLRRRIFSWFRKSDSPETAASSSSSNTSSTN